MFGNNHWLFINASVTIIFLRLGVVLNRSHSSPVLSHSKQCSSTENNSKLSDRCCLQSRRKESVWNGKSCNTKVSYVVRYFQSRLPVEGYCSFRVNSRVFSTGCKVTAKGIGLTETRKIKTLVWVMLYIIFNTISVKLLKAAIVFWPTRKLRSNGIQGSNIVEHIAISPSSCCHIFAVFIFHRRNVLECMVRSNIIWQQNV